MFRKLKSGGILRYTHTLNFFNVTGRRDIAASLKGTLGKNLLRKLTNDGKHSSLNNNKFRYAAYSSRYPAIKKETQRSLLFVAGETRFEHATYGFGDRYSTVEPLPYERCLFYYKKKFKSIDFNGFLLFLLFFKKSVVKFYAFIVRISVFRHFVVLFSRFISPDFKI